MFKMKGFVFTTYIIVSARTVTWWFNTSLYLFLVQTALLYCACI